MHATAVVALLLAAAPLSVEGERVVAPLDAPPLTEPAVALSAYVLGAAAVAVGGAAGVLLSLPLTVPILYVAALGSLPTAVGALPLLLAVPFAAALGSGGVASAFSEGIAPWLVGTLSGAAAGLTLLAVGAVVVAEEPRTLLDLHLGVLSLVGVPSLAAAATAAVIVPFFVTGTAAAIE